MKDTLGLDIHAEPIPKSRLIGLPLYLSESYNLYDTNLLGHPIVLLDPGNGEYISLKQTVKNLELLKNAFNAETALLVEELPVYQRKRLIQSRIGFIVPGKQLFLPELFLDLRERVGKTPVKRKNKKLLPSAQLLVLFHMLHKHDKWQLEGSSFKNIAFKLGYTSMGITKAVENLKFLDLIIVEGTKEKSVRFRLDRHELWGMLVHENLLVSPVIKKVFVDEIPKGVYMLQSNESALPEYSNMNPSRQQYYAIGKKEFYELQETKVWVNANDQDGPYCIEAWKYDPIVLINELPNSRGAVDPLSLYLSLKEVEDERIEIALKQILSETIDK